MSATGRNWALVVAIAVAAAAIGGLLAVVLDGDDARDRVGVVDLADNQPVPSDVDPRDFEDPAPAIELDERPVGGAEARRVANAALRITDGGALAGLERSDDPGEAWEVEVIRQGTEIDIALDAQLRRVPNNPYDD